MATKIRDNMSEKFKNEKLYNELLLRACEINNKEDFKFAIQNGADVNYCNNFKQTPLMFALLNANMSFVSQLKNLGADLGAVDSNRNNLLHYALGLDYKMSYSHYNPSERAKCVSAIFSPEKSDLDLLSSNEIAPLHLACFYGVNDTIELLSKNGANVNIIDAKGRTPLFLCYKGNHGGKDDILFKYGAEVNKNSWQNFSTLYYVLASSLDNKTKYEIANKLIDKGATIEAMQLDYSLNEQIAKGVFNTAEMLIKKKISKNLDAVNDTAYRSFINMTDHTALYEYLIGKKDYKNAKLAIQMGIDLDEQVKKTGETRLIKAVKENDKNYVKFLIENGALINVRDKENKSATQFAIENNSKELAIYLMKNGGNIYVDKPTFEKLKEIMGSEYDELLTAHSIVHLGNYIKKTGIYSKENSKQ